jgi:hypothetical protein
MCEFLTSRPLPTSKPNLFWFALSYIIERRSNLSPTYENFFKKKIKEWLAEASEGEPNRRSLTEQGGNDSNDIIYLFSFFWRLGRLWGVIFVPYILR